MSHYWARKKQLSERTKLKHIYHYRYYTVPYIPKKYQKLMSKDQKNKYRDILDKFVEMKSCKQFKVPDHEVDRKESRTNGYDKNVDMIYALERKLVRLRNEVIFDYWSHTLKIDRLFVSVNNYHMYFYTSPTMKVMTRYDKGTLYAFVEPGGYLTFKGVHPVTGMLSFYLHKAQIIAYLPYEKIDKIKLATFNEE